MQLTRSPKSIIALGKRKLITFFLALVSFFFIALNFTGGAEAKSTCTANQLSECSNKEICKQIDADSKIVKNTTESVTSQIWGDPSIRLKAFQTEGKSRGLACANQKSIAVQTEENSTKSQGVTSGIGNCNAAQLSQCSKKEICLQIKSFSSINDVSESQRTYLQIYVKTFKAEAQRRGLACGPSTHEVGTKPVQSENSGNANALKPSECKLAHSEAVELQYLLRRSGTYSGDIDGEIGPKSIKASEAYIEKLSHDLDEISSSENDVRAFSESCQKENFETIRSALMHLAWLKFNVDQRAEIKRTLKISTNTTTKEGGRWDHTTETAVRSFLSGKALDDLAVHPIYNTLLMIVANNENSNDPSTTLDDSLLVDELSIALATQSVDCTKAGFEAKLVICRNSKIQNLAKIDANLYKALRQSATYTEILDAGNKEMWQELFKCPYDIACVQKIYENDIAALVSFAKGEGSFENRTGYYFAKEDLEIFSDATLSSTLKAMVVSGSPIVVLENRENWSHIGIIGSNIDGWVFTGTSSANRIDFEAFDFSISRRYRDAVLGDTPDATDTLGSKLAPMDTDNPKQHPVASGTEIGPLSEQSAQQDPAGNMVVDDNGAELKAAQIFITDVEAYVGTGKSGFDIQFPKLYAKVQGVKKSTWGLADQTNFRSFSEYVNGYDSFVGYRNSQVELRLKQAADHEKQIRETLSAETLQLSDWVKSNLMDLNSAKVADAVQSNESALKSASLEVIESRLKLTESLLIDLNLAPSPNPTSEVASVAEAFKPAVDQHELTAATTVPGVATSSTPTNEVGSESTQDSADAESTTVSQAQTVPQVGADPISTSKTSKIGDLASAQTLIADVEAYVEAGNTGFDLRFPKFYAKVGSIKTGSWSESDRSALHSFIDYISKDEGFLAFHASMDVLRLKQQEDHVRQVTDELSRKTNQVSEWVKINLLDGRAAMASALIELNEEAIKSNEPSKIEKLLKASDELLIKLDIVADIDVKQDQITVPSTSAVDSSLQSALTSESNQPTALEISVPTINDIFAAQNFLLDVEVYVKSGASTYDLSFPKLYKSVSQVREGAWSSEIKSHFVTFAEYVNRDQGFAEYHAGQDAIRAKELQDKTKSAVDLLAEKTSQLNQWTKLNLLDARSSEAADAIQGNHAALEGGDLALFEQRIKLTDDLLEKLGLSTEIVAQTAGGSPYNNDSIYIFGNTSGKAENIFKDLSGKVSFDKGAAIVCFVDISEKLRRLTVSNFLTDKLGVTRGSLFVGSCRGTDDVFAALGATANAGSIPHFDSSQMIQIAEIPRSATVALSQELDLTSSLYEKDLESGAKVGYGLLVFDDTNMSVCVIESGALEDHISAINEHLDIIDLYINRELSFDKADDAVDAFKRIQQKTCGSVYGDEKTILVLIEAAKNNSMMPKLVPIWISNSDLQRIGEIRAEQITGQLQDEQSRAAAEELQAQALKSAMDSAAVKQSEFRLKNDVAFAALTDSMSDILKEAIDFGLSNSPLDVDYNSKYSGLSFIDEITHSSSPFDSLIEGMQQNALEKWEVSNISVERVDYGSLNFGGRYIIGEIIKLNVDMKNRLVGKFATDCHIVRAAFDTDFDMWRQVEVSPCDKDNSQSWKLANSFESQWVVELPQ